MPNLLLVILLSGFPAISTDMYLPAIPALQQLWSISLPEANASLVVFFVSFSFFLLVHGPLSDRFGRKPVLIVGIILFILGCLLCAAAQSITQLVAARMVQAVGAAAASSLSLALAKDIYRGPQLQKVMAYVGVIIPLCPMIAPMLGGWMLASFSWRFIFLTQAALALPALYGAFRLRETLNKRTTGGVLSVVSRYGALLRNRRYVLMALIFSVTPISFYAFIGGSSTIYITTFRVSAQTYGLYFGFNALALMLGSFLCSRLTSRIQVMTILRWSLTGVALCGLALAVTAGTSPMSFALPMFGISFFLGLSRPMSNALVLEQVRQDIGAASSVLIFSFFLMGALGMELVSLDFWSRPILIAIMAVLGGLLPLLTLGVINRLPQSQ